MLDFNAPFLRNVPGVSSRRMIKFQNKMQTHQHYLCHPCCGCRTLTTSNSADSLDTRQLSKPSNRIPNH